MTGLERMIAKVSNLVDRHEPAIRVPDAAEIEIEQIYLTRLDAIDAAEKAFAAERRSHRRMIDLGCQ